MIYAAGGGTTGMSTGSNSGPGDRIPRPAQGAELCNEVAFGRGLPAAATPAFLAECHAHEVTVRRISRVFRCLSWGRDGSSALSPATSCITTFRRALDATAFVGALGLRVDNALTCDLCDESRAPA